MKILQAPLKSARIIFSDGYPLLCGGQASWTDTLSSCYVYIPSNDSWVLTGYMNDPKGGSAYGQSILHNIYKSSLKTRLSIL